jgi:predicted nucleic acid-binding protein
MVPRHLFDANTSIYIRRRRPAEILKRFRALQPGDTVIPEITYGELLWRREEPGASASGRSPLDDLITLIPIAAASAAAGAIRRFGTRWHDDREQRPVDCGPCAKRRAHASDEHRA